jgi:hypothetical protein
VFESGRGAGESVLSITVVVVGLSAEHAESLASCAVYTGIMNWKLSFPLDATEPEQT